MKNKIKEENKVNKWIKNHKKEIIIIGSLCAITVGGILIGFYIKNKNDNKMQMINNKAKSLSKETKRIGGITKELKIDNSVEIPIIQNDDKKISIIEDEHIKKVPRLTKGNREKLLKLNEGYSCNTYHKERNYRMERKYTINNGELIIEEKSKTSWADSCKTKVYKADDEQIHRFLYKNRISLNTDI